VFLLLMAQQKGLSDLAVIGVYVFYNLVYALFSFPFGWLADRFGMKISMCLGLLFFAITYAGMSLNVDLKEICLLFFCYGLYAAATDGVSKAWMSKLVPKTETGAALGFLAGMVSLSALCASSLTGLIWTVQDGKLAMMLSGGVAILVLVYLLAGTREKA
jgi:MFS family permease